MKTIKKEAFSVIGISIRTTNENGQAAQDIPKLWSKFMSENIAEKIPNKLSNDIFSIYTNYEGDHTKPYDTILACQVENLDNIPEGLIGQHFEESNYAITSCKGDLTQGLVYNKWLEIWETPLDRIFTADFEIYGEKAQNPKDATVDILIAVK